MDVGAYQIQINGFGEFFDWGEFREFGYKEDNEVSTHRDPQVEHSLNLQELLENVPHILSRGI